MSCCARCGATLHCARVDGALVPDAPCWCMSLPAVLPLPDQAAPDGACWCPDCLRLALAAAPVVSVPAVPL